MKLKELAKRLGKTTQTIRKWDDNQLALVGFKREGEGRDLEFLPVGDLLSPAMGETSVELKRKKLEAEVLLLEQKLASLKKAQFKEWADQYTELIMKCFSEFTEYIAKSRFSKDEADKLNEVMNKCLEKLQKESEKFSNSQDI
jgi:DNA-binding transcriptional MerR regulator